MGIIGPPHEGVHADQRPIADAERIFLKAEEDVTPEEVSGQHVAAEAIPPGAPGALRIGVIEAFREMGRPAQRLRKNRTFSASAPPRTPSPRLRGEGWGEGPLESRRNTRHWGTRPCARIPTSPRKRGEVNGCGVNFFTGTQLVFHRPHAQSRVALEDTGENQMPERDPHPVIRVRQERRALRQLSSGGGIPANGRFVAMCKLKCISRSWAAAQKGS